MLFKINPQSFNAITACAAKDDVRYYLNTFYVDTDNERLVATNGHILAFAPLEKVETGDVDAEPRKSQFSNGFLFNSLDKPVSNSGEDVYINCADNTLWYQTGYENRTIKLEKCEGTFPDYDEVKYKKDMEAVEEIAFQSHYVAKMAKWAGLEHSKAVFSFNGQFNAMGIEIKDKKLADVHITLMPCSV